jgi:hypothetical protein
VKRGRKSTAELAVVQGSFGNRPEPPSELNEDEAAAWREVVGSEPADFFSTAALRGLLVDYCRHRGTAEMLNGLIASFKQELLKMRESETRAAASMATKLRLTNQSRYTPQAASTASRGTAKGFKPWEM